MIYELLLPYSLHSQQIPPGNFWCHFDFYPGPLINPLITRATNKEILVSAFQEKFPADLVFISQICQICTAMSANDVINFWEQTIFK